MVYKSNLKRGRYDQLKQYYAKGHVVSGLSLGQDIFGCLNLIWAFFWAQFLTVL